MTSQGQRRPTRVSARVGIVVCAVLSLLCLSALASANNRGYKTLTCCGLYGTHASIETPGGGFVFTLSQEIGLEQSGVEGVDDMHTRFSGVQVGFAETKGGCFDSDCVHCNFQNGLHYYYELAMTASVVSCNDLGSAGSFATHLFGVLHQSGTTSTWGAFTDGNLRASEDTGFSQINGQQDSFLKEGGEINSPLTGLPSAYVWGCFGAAGGPGGCTGGTPWQYATAPGAPGWYNATTVSQINDSGWNLPSNTINPSVGFTVYHP